MNTIKKYLGIVWIILGPAVIIFMVMQAIEKIGMANDKAAGFTDALKKAAATSEAHNTLLQWSIIIIVFVPIAIGMVIFGKYCLGGEYERLPQSSGELGI